MGMVSTPSLKLREHCKSYASYWCSGWPLSGTALIPISCTPSPLSQITNPNLLHLLLLRDSPDNLSAWLLLWSEVKRATFPHNSRALHPSLPCERHLTWEIRTVPGTPRWRDPHCGPDPRTDTRGRIRIARCKRFSKAAAAAAQRQECIASSAILARKEEPRAEDCGTLEDWTWRS